MNQITASVFTEFEQGYGYMVTEYMGDCGCLWKVDQWGNVRAVRVCPECMKVGYSSEQQLGLFTQPAEVE